MTGTTTSGPYQFDNLLNFRDVGAYVSRILGAPALKPCLLFRSARPDECSASDRDQLVNKFRIATVIDLRSTTEHINAVQKHSEMLATTQPAEGPLPTSAVAGPLKISDLRYVEINLNGKGFERHLVWQLKYTSLAKLVILMGLGYRTQAISVLGSELMQSRGLVGLALDTLDHSGPEIKEVFDVLADRSAYPVLVHCTQGKDRTGLIIILVLLLCSVDLEAISDDYVQSEPELEREREGRLKEIASIGLDESFASCPSDFCDKILQHITSVHGDVDNYLGSVGVSEEQRDEVRRILTG